MTQKTNTVLLFGHHADGTIGAFLAKDFITSSEDYAERRHFDVAFKMAEKEGFQPLVPILAFDEHRLKPLESIVSRFTELEIVRMARESKGEPSKGAVTVVAGFNGQGNPGFSYFFCPELTDDGKPDPAAAIDIALNHPLHNLADPCLVFDDKAFKRIIYPGTQALRMALVDTEHRFDGLAHAQSRRSTSHTVPEADFHP